MFVCLVVKALLPVVKIIFPNEKLFVSLFRNPTMKKLKTYPAICALCSKEPLDCRI
jgi:hypothetical protein